MLTLEDVKTLTRALLSGNDQALLDLVGSLPAEELAKLDKIRVTRELYNMMTGLPLLHNSYDIWIIGNVAWKVIIIETAPVPEKPVIGPRRYDRSVSYCELLTVEEWKKRLKQGTVWPSEGKAYWANNRYKSLDNAFADPQLDATHVAWYQFSTHFE